MNGHGNSNSTASYCCGAYDFQPQERQAALITPYYNQQQGVPPVQVQPIGNRPMMPDLGKTTTPAPMPGTTPMPMPGTTPMPMPGAMPAPMPGAMPAPMPGRIPTTLSGEDYLPGLLKNYIGQRIYVEFLVGTTGPLIDRLGTLLQVGTNYIMIQPSDTDDLQTCDLYSIKFVTILR